MLCFIKNTGIFDKNLIMNTKLTLTLEKEVIQTAKEYAKEQGISLSQIVENYFKLITVSKRDNKPEVLPSKVQKLRGIIKVDEDFDYKKTLTQELSNI
ncbi:hypothetical protein GCM10010832_17710 [Psychroflexus planctonicus]|uniref:Antitoxin n=2 Tax=Psychroflexus planctonicus TaxID=1526575 RepID=A0ABQ1SGA0_9FLAO|nr:hypothetical protein GCM10010832_17710 [Psychroflexus planctonicus]